MISAWKRLINKTTIDDGSPTTNVSGGVGSMPPGIHKLDKELQRKFARGVNYNMKVVIKGDNRVGKTSLFLRLKGYGFEENYNPTESLNVTSIDWGYRATDDVVKIDLWEAVDAAVSKRRVNFVDLKMENGQDGTQQATANGGSNGQVTNGQAGAAEFGQQQPAGNGCSATRVTITSTKLHPNSNNHLPDSIPDSARKSLAELSENLDVYKGADAVLLVMDMTKLWTFKYIQSELPNVPRHIPVLVVANHMDQSHHRTVSSEQVKAFLEGQPREPGDGVLMYAEASMKNGFGLKLIERFFNVPFLKLQEATLLKQLELNRQEYLTTFEELHLMEESTNKEYEQYLELQTIKRRQQADAMSPVNRGLTQLDESTREQIRNTSMSSDIMDKRGADVKSIESDSRHVAKSPVTQQNHHQSFVNDRMPSIVIGAKCPLPERKSVKMSGFGNELNQHANDSSNHSSGAAEQHNEEEAGGGSDDSEDDDDEARANPLVADYQSDIDSDDQLNK